VVFSEKLTVGLNIRFVQNLNQIIAPVTDYLSADLDVFDLFEKQFLIVPTAGVRAWLVPQLAAHIGATPTDNGTHRDGIFSNVTVGYIGLLNTLLQNGQDEASDAWSIEHVTMAVLGSLLSQTNKQDPLVKKYGGPLRAARAIADRFDRYAARRPGLIREWEHAYSSGHVYEPVNLQHESQYLLWKEVRHIIGVPSWPARTEQICADMRNGITFPWLPRRLMVAGIESMSMANLELLQALGHVMPVDVVCVHPSPQLFHMWSDMAAKQFGSSQRVPVRLDDVNVPEGCDVLPSTWLRGSFELQMLLASQGETGHEYLAEPVDTTPVTLLQRVQRTIEQPNTTSAASLGFGDHSVQIHRAHNLARQVDVLHDALLHAFRDIPDLHPHEILVLCADIETAAPLLQARFDQPVVGADERSVQIPLVVADRSLREISQGAELLNSILDLIGTRFDQSHVLAIAAHELVLKNLHLGNQDVEIWTRYAESTRVRWGLDIEHRTQAGLDAPSITAHTWKQAIDRALLGTLLPDAVIPVREMGHVVPLTHMDTADFESFTGLVYILGALARLEEESRVSMPITFWCDELESVLISLCGERCTEIDDALTVINSFRQSCILQQPENLLVFNEAVRFEEFADLIQQKLSTSPGRQPLRTGAVTATSFVPLRAVPFRVVCVLGLDDGTLAVGESEGDDIVSQEPMMGDPDPRFDLRRVLLDAVLAASDQLIITCNGRSIKNNASIPLVTPLAELVDFCGRLGVNVPEDIKEKSEIEHKHPRHHSGYLNFVSTNGPIEGKVWSHNAAARVAAENINSSHSSKVISTVAAIADSRTDISLENIEWMVIDPLQYYIRETLRIFNNYEKADPGAVMPTEIDKFDIANACQALVEESGGHPIGVASSQWREVMEATDVMPVGVYGEEALNKVVDITTAIVNEAIGQGVPVLGLEPLVQLLQLDNELTLQCSIPNVLQGEHGSVVYSVLYSDNFAKDVMKISVRLLVLRALGYEVDRGVVVHRAATKNLTGVEIIRLGESITAVDALNRLVSLVVIEPHSRTMPCPRFGDTSTQLSDDEEAISEFEKYIESFGYNSSTECLVYGSSPSFDDVYLGEGSPVREFFEALHGALALEKLEKTRGNPVQEWLVK